MDFGATLRAARESKHLTTSQVAAQTRILVQIIEDMEREDFHQIVAPIYGRGFVRLYCECVGIDPKPLIEEFSAIYEGRRTPIVKTREIPTAPVPPAAPVEAPAPVDAPIISMPEPEAVPEPVAVQAPDAMPEPVIPEPIIPEPVAVDPIPEPPAPVENIFTAPPPAAEPPPPVSADVAGLDLFDQASAAPAHAPAPMAPVESAPVDLGSDDPLLAGIISAGSVNETDDNSRFATPYGDYSDDSSPAERFRNSMSSVSDSVISSVSRIKKPALKIALLALIGIVVLWLIIKGLVALFNATNGAPDHPIDKPMVIQADSTKKTAAKETKASKDAKQDPAPAAKKQTKKTNRPGFYVD